MRARHPALFVGFVAVGLAALLPARDTSACGNEVELRLTPANLVSDAEKLANDGRVKGAQDYIATFMRDPIPDYGASPLTDRALVVSARSVVRSDGELGMPKPPTDKSAKASPEGGDTQRIANLKEAATLLGKVIEKKPDDPTAQTDLAEAQARIPGEEAKAKAALEALESKSVMSSAWGYAALAQLRAQRSKEQPAWLAAATHASEQAPRAVSIARCEKMAQGSYKDICAGKKLENALTPVPLPASVRSRGLGRSLD
jgi:hypothetical protein